MADLVKLTALSAALRKPLPERTSFDISQFMWESETCGTVVCAIGLGMVLGIIKTPAVRDTYLTDTAAELDMGEKDYDHLFMPYSYKGNPHPRQVADRIDAYIKTQR
jgi:hypothetical protein